MQEKAVVSIFFHATAITTELGVRLFFCQFSFSSSTFFFPCSFVLCVYSDFALYKVVRACLCLLRFAPEGAPRRITAVSAWFRAPPPALCKNSSIVEVLKLVISAFFFFRSFFQVDAKQRPLRRRYLISVHSHSLSHVRTPSHILPRSYFFKLEHTV